MYVERLSMVYSSSFPEGFPEPQAKVNNKERHSKRDDPHRTRRMRTFHSSLPLGNRILSRMDLPVTQESYMSSGIVSILHTIIHCKARYCSQEP